MPIGRIGNSLVKRVDALEENNAHGYVRVIVTGTSTGFGGTEQPVYVPTVFKVKNAVANLAKEYDLRDATQIYNFGDDVFAGEMKCNVDDTLTVGFYVEYKQLDPNEPWELCFNWFARG
jgi:hypothetical protein